MGLLPSPMAQTVVALLRSLTLIFSFKKEKTFLKAALFEHPRGDEKNALI